jgi:hypothetical protein
LERPNSRVVPPERKARPRWFLPAALAAHAERTRTAAFWSFCVKNFCGWLYFFRIFLKYYL